VFHQPLAGAGVLAAPVAATAGFSWWHRCKKTFLRFLTFFIFQTFFIFIKRWHLQEFEIQWIHK